MGLAAKEEGPALSPAAPRRPPPGIGSPARLLLALALVRCASAVFVRNRELELRLDESADGTAPAPPPTPEDVVHVAYGTTRDGFGGLLHSMLSLARHLRKKEKLEIHVITVEEDMELAGQVLNCFREELKALTANGTIPRGQTHASLRKMLPLGWNTSAMRTSQAGVNRNWGHQDKLSKPTVFARFYLKQLLPQLTRVLWLDVDTIVNTSVATLYRAPMTHMIAAKMTYNTTVESMFRNWGPSCLQGADPALRIRYFNTGVLLLDLSRWRHHHTAQLEKAARLCLCNDQPAFNIVFMNNVDLIGRPWNTMALGSPGKSPEAREGKILHWSGPVKPWEEPAKCKGLGDARVNDTDCLNRENMAFYESFGPRTRCPALREI